MKATSTQTTSATPPRIPAAALGDNFVCLLAEVSEVAAGVHVTSVETVATGRGSLTNRLLVQPPSMVIEFSSV